MAKAVKERMRYTSIEDLAKKLNKEYGAGTAILGKETEDIHVTYYSTGCFALDVALRGGFAYNRIVELIGEEQTCKSTLCALAGNSFLKDNPDGIVAIVDLENTVDFDWLRRNGCRLDRFIVISADSGEQSGNQVDDVVGGGDFPVLLIVDSLMAMVPLGELQQDMEQNFVGAQPRLINRVVRIANARLKSAKVGSSPRTSVILVNQTRPKIGMVFGNPMDSSGGQGRKFFASQRIQMSSQSSAEKEKDGTKDSARTSHIGKKVSFSIIKNKAGGPEENGRFMFYNRPYKGIPVGIDNAHAALHLGKLYRVVKLKGTTYSYGTRKLGIGEPKALAKIREDYDEDWCVRMRQEIMDKAIEEFTGEKRGISTSAKTKRVSKSASKKKKVAAAGKRTGVKVRRTGAARKRKR